MNENTKNIISSESTKKINSIKSKIESISAKFDLAESLVEPEVEEVLTNEVKDIVENKREYHPIDVMSLEQMAEDFKFSRETLQECITNGRAVLEKATQDLLLQDDKGKSGVTMAFAELTTAVLNGVKTHSHLYKEFSTTLLNIKKINSDNNVTNVTNNLNVTENITPTELIEKLKKAK